MPTTAAPAAPDPGRKPRIYLQPDFLGGPVERIDLDAPVDLRPRAQAQRRPPITAEEKEQLGRRAQLATIEAAWFLGCSDQHILNLIAEGLLKAVNVALHPDRTRPSYRVYVSSLKEYEAKRQEGAQ